MILRRFKCHNCGAVSEDAATEVYVYCKHCEAPIDYDLQVLWRLCRQNEYKRWQQGLAAGWPAKEAARTSGDRQRFMELDREDVLRSLQDIPSMHPEAVRKPGEIQERYLEWYIRCDAERTFNPELVKRYADHAAESTKRFRQEPGGPTGIRTAVSGPDLVAIIESWIEVSRFERRVCDENGINDLCPVPLIPEQQEKTLVSGMFQGYSQFLDEEAVRFVIAHFHMGESFSWKVSTDTGICCGTCGDQIGGIEKGSSVECPGCGTLITDGAVAFGCSGCGAPLTLNRDADYGICPWCGTVANNATFQPLNDFADAYTELQCIARDTSSI